MAIFNRKFDDAYERIAYDVPFDKSVVVNEAHYRSVDPDSLDRETELYPAEWVNQWQGLEGSQMQHLHDGKYKDYQFSDAR